ncbi:Plant peroxidase [Corchorus capsularis]|uniref:peroxidase n=1 Tax=Corchorus capsularis TaxID=210143 RepID=A0A1R3IS96_COCAP|nr:Plant peroxidase [Corchorus capsularis]
MEVRTGLMLFLVFMILQKGEGQLSETFYSKTCPKLESIVKQVVANKISQTFVTIPATLRLFFHDCFVEGCDASVLIASPNGDAEKDAPDNLSLAGDGFDTVIKAKQAVENKCPRVVSCADILALATKEVVAQAGGPSWKVELGRRDGLISQASRVAGNLPEPNATLIQLNAIFAKNNLTQTDMIALSGAHTNLVAKKGLFTSDEVLFTNPASQPTVIDFAQNPGDFNAAFITAMRKLGRVGVKTGKAGQIRGCDASVMIASRNHDAEKDSSDNLSLAGDGFDTVIKAKKAVEAKCPKVVSCADILAIATRDVIALAGGPSYKVELGRRDGLVSQASRVAGNLPEPNFNLTQLNTIFAKNNLSQTDMIALSGAHTLGFSHCKPFANRLYSFSPSSPVDPDLDPTYAEQLKQDCPPNVDPRIAVDMDPRTPRKFDNVYFKNLVVKKGLFTSDQVLFTDPASKQTVIDFAKNQTNFKAAFVTAMTKLGRVGVKTGKTGEIRVDCTAFNA